MKTSFCFFVFLREVSCARAGEGEDCRPKEKERTWEVLNIYTYGREDYVDDDVLMEAVRKGEGGGAVIVCHEVMFTRTKAEQTKYECEHLSVGRS